MSFFDICFRIIVFFTYIFWYALSLSTLFFLPMLTSLERVFGGHYEFIGGERKWVACSPFTISKPYEAFTEITWAPLAEKVIFSQGGASNSQSIDQTQKQTESSSD